MEKRKRRQEEYRGFEQGPIRPPSEAASLLIRVTRNCPWNRCAFCPVYKGSRFSLRPVEHVLADIDTVHRFVRLLRGETAGEAPSEDLSRLAADLNHSERTALSTALNWQRGGMRSIFLQDANSLIIKPDDLLRILAHLQERFPWVERTTSYARSHTICRIKDDKLAEMRRLGLNRIHIGMESGSDAVLKMIHKGTTKAEHIEAGLKVKGAGMELSEYVMPGLGGREHSREHALETAAALNAIDPSFIRLRSLAIPNHVELHGLLAEGGFSKLNDHETALELRLFLQSLEGITSTLKSDHILNLFEEIEGTFPHDKEKMIGVIDTFLALSPHEQMLYQVGRRTGVMNRLAQLDDPERRAMAQAGASRFGITPENVDQAVDELMKRFI